MGTEVERKFLVRNENWRRHCDAGALLKQGYLANNERCSVRVRVSNGQAWINMKSATLGVERLEFEYPIPHGDAEQILEALCVTPFIEKTRYRVPLAGHIWEVDVFAGENAGLVIAEIELTQADAAFEKPDWAGAEVSDDPRYYNVCLVKHPYKSWAK